MMAWTDEILSWLGGWLVCWLCICTCREDPVQPRSGAANAGSHHVTQLNISQVIALVL